MTNSYNELFGLGSHTEDAALEGWWKLQDDAASTVVLDSSSNGLTATLGGGDNTSAKSVVGPTGKAYLPKAFILNGTDDRVDALITDLETSDFGFGLWVSNSASGHILLSVADKDTPNNQHRLGNTFNSPSASTFDGAIKQATGATTISDASWRFLSANFAYQSQRTVFLNGVSEASDSTADSATGFDRITIGVSGDSTPFGFSTASLAEAVLFSRTLTASEWAQIYNGPEPLNTVSPTLTIDGSLWSGTVGTWDSQSNGTITYSWELRDNDDDSVVDSGITASTTMGGSGSFSGSYYLWVRASNSGGHDAAEDSVSSVEAVGVSGTTVTPPAASLTLTTFASTVEATANIELVPSVASLTLTTFAPTVAASDAQEVTPATASLTLTGFAPAIAISDNQSLTPGTASLTLTKFAPEVAVSNNITIIPALAELAITPFAPSITANADVLVTPAAASLTITTFRPSLGDEVSSASYYYYLLMR